MMGFSECVVNRVVIFIDEDDDLRTVVLVEHTRQLGYRFSKHDGIQFPAEHIIEVFLAYIIEDF